MKRVRTPLLITCLLIPVTVILRVVSVVRYSDAATDWFSLAAAGLLVLFAVLLLLASWGKDQVSRRPYGRRAMAVAILCMVSGGALLLCNLSDFIGWVTTGVTPPPVNYSVQLVDGLLLTLQLLFGCLGGLYLLYVGFVWLQKKACEARAGSWPALFWVLWGWFRLARYAVSYVSATGLGDTVYDYGYLIFCLLFLMLLAHFVAGTRPVRHANWIAAALPTAWFGIAGVLATCLLFLLPDSALQREFHAGNIANWADLPLAVTALFLAADALLSQPEKAVPKETDHEESASKEDA